MNKRPTTMYVVHPNLGVTSTKGCHKPVTSFNLKGYNPQHECCHSFLKNLAGS